MDENDGTDQGSTRRALLKKGVVAGGVAWIAPAVITSPAFASYSRSTCPLALSGDWDFLGPVPPAKLNISGSIGNGWTVSPGAVDAIRDNGTYWTPAGSSGFATTKVILDSVGTGSNRATLSRTLSCTTLGATGFIPGSYVFSFDYAGSQRGSVSTQLEGRVSSTPAGVLNTVTSPVIASTTTVTTLTVPFTIGIDQTSVTIQIRELIGTVSIGSLLGNYSIV